MEMLAANKMNLRRISAAGWQEGESDVGEGDDRTGSREGVEERRGMGTQRPLRWLFFNATVTCMGGQPGRIWGKQGDGNMLRNEK